MHFCRFFFSALKEEQPPRTNERNFQTVIYFIRQMRCVSPLAVLTRNGPLSLARSLFLSLLYVFVFLSRINVHRTATLGVCMLHVLWWPYVHIHAYAARHVQSSSGMTGTEVFAREQLLPC